MQLETANPLRCFKGRDADHFASQVAVDEELVCGSAGGTRHPGPRPRR
ncbi:hypothetical protein [Allokutzneria oryzae]|uniref:Uncharacterized protein n=1 Tax=Allokutzneria oryzae TaxID=1378989 RepID=A0ABV6A196_9PSEU